MKTQLVYPAWPHSQQLHLQLRLWLSGAALLTSGVLLWFPLGLFTRLWIALLLVLSWQKLIQSLGNYAEALAEHCQLKAARRYVNLVLKLSPRRADLWQTLGNIEADLENWQAAQSAYQQAQNLHPNLIEAFNGLGFAALLRDDTRTAHSHFKQAYELRRGKPGQALNPPSNSSTTDIPAFSPLKLKHDLEQWQWLLQAGLLPVAFQRHCETLADWYQKRAQSHSLMEFVEWPAGSPLEAVWGQNLVCVEPQLSAGQALEPLPQTLKDAISAPSEALAPVYWDQFLSPEALLALQDFCLNATIWHDGSRRAGYLASTLDDGFNCPLLYQIAQELRAALPELFADQHLVYMWAFKCDSEGQGIALHNDSAFLNLNFWLTPDHANGDPESGGLLIYPSPPPSEWNFEELRMDQAGIETWLEAHPQPPLHIPYRCNRAVLFRSRLFHASDHYRFQPGYANRRINITLLFGKKILKYYPRPTLLPLREG